MSAEAQAHALLEQHPLISLIVDGHGDVVWMNARARHLLLAPGAALPVPAPLPLTTLTALTAPTTHTGPEAAASQEASWRAADGQVRRWHIRSSGLPGHQRLCTLTPVDTPNPRAGQQGRVTEDWALARSHDEAVTQLGAAVDLGRIAIWRHDLRSGRMHYNDNAYAVLGLTPRPEGLPIEAVRARIHPEDLPAVLANVERSLASDEPIDQEVRYWRPDGWRTVLTRRAVQRDLDGKAVAFTGVSLDVTEQREESRRAQEMTRRFELATGTAGIGYWSLEHGADQARWTDQLYTMHGLPPGAALPGFDGWTNTFVHAEDRASLRRSFLDWRRSGQPSLEAHFRIVRADRAVVDVISHSRIEGAAATPLLFGVVINVTERRAAELALRRAGERAALIAQGVGIGTWELDLLSNQSQWDEQMWRLRGRAPAGQAMAADERIAITHPDDREKARRVFKRLVRDATPIDYEFRVQWPDGSWRWLASRSIAVLDGQGRPVRRIGVNWDVTAARTAALAHEEKVAAQREVLAKSRFLSRMSHELRTPLNAVLGFTQLLLSETAAAGSVPNERRLRHIASAGQHLLSLIDDVLELSRLEGGEVTIAMAPVALPAVVAAALALVETQAREQGVHIVTGALDIVPMADEVRLRQVLLNLLTNAIKYNRRGGTIIIDAARAGDQVRLAVSDTGRGMTPEQLAHLFEPFNRLGLESTGVEGTGIGLAIVKALVDRMGGSIAVSSHAGSGSRFELTLRDGSSAGPAPQDLASPQALALAASAGRVGRGGTVLYVEDNPVNAMIVSELLARRRDLTLHIAVDGTSGVAKAQALKPDLVLLDMQLPDFDGMQVLHRLKADPATASIPCIALSANAMPHDIERALQAGFADYWTKPLDFRAFMASIDALFGPDPG